MNTTAKRNTARRRRGTRHISLALQGGGAHGAYTWGVLDRLVEEPTLRIEAVSGTSAGAMNGALFVDGWTRGGRDGVQHALRTFWREVSKAGDAAFNPWRYADAWPALRGLAGAWSEALARLWSPYDNPVYRNPLADIVSATIDFGTVQRARRPRLFVCATNVLTNERRVFAGRDLGAAALLASACLPTLFQAVEIAGEHYWDGGYTGNPALGPLLPCSDDMLIVEVNALRRTSVPTSATEIFNRLNEVSFNASLVQEIDTIETMNRLVASGALEDRRYRIIRFHAIEADGTLAALGADSKHDTDWNFLRHLHALGRAAAQRWLDDPDQFGAVGRASSIDVERRFCALAPGRISGGKMVGVSGFEPPASTSRT
ncbi:MAG TPA: patatin-like phospholipase family protein [Casimicrobiaceae bacterium]